MISNLHAPKVPLGWLAIGLMSCVGCAPLASPTTAAPVLTGRKISSQTKPSFSSKERGFSMWLPVKPTLKQKTVSDGGLTMKAYTYSAKTDSVTYGIVCSPVPANTDSSGSKAQFDIAQTGFVKSSHGTLIGHEDIQLDGIPGRQLTVSVLNGQFSGRARFFFTPKNSYNLIAIGESAAMQKQAAQITKVFDSFRILPQ